MTWVQTFKKLQKKGLPKYVQVVNGKIVSTSDKVGVAQARKKWLSQKSTQKYLRRKRR